MEEEASGVKLHLGVSVIPTWSIEILHHRNRDMRDRDEIWIVGSLEISTVEQHLLAQPVVTTGGHVRGRS
jgi:hypothetical protein